MERKEKIQLRQMFRSQVIMVLSNLLEECPVSDEFLASDCSNPDFVDSVNFSRLRDGLSEFVRTLRTLNKYDDLELKK